MAFSVSKSGTLVDTARHPNLRNARAHRRCFQRLAPLILTVWLAVHLPTALAQAPSTPSLPDSPMPFSGSTSPVQTPEVQRGMGTITGQISDPVGNPLEGAVVAADDGSQRHACQADSSSAGHFSCPGLPPGSYRLQISAPGYANHTSENVSITTDHPVANLEVKLTLAGENTVVTVSASAHEIATEQVHLAEKQRIIGIVPNFYTSFTKDAAPLSSGQKFSLAFRDLVDPFTFVGAGITAGIEQAHGTYAGYGQGAAGYGKRFAAAYGDGLTSDLFRHAIYASLFHQDPRYFYQGTGSVRSRFMHAISFAVLLRGDDGRLRPNYSYVAGYLTSGALSNAYYPHADRGAGLVFNRALVGVAGTAGEGLLREFVLNHLTTHRHSLP